MVFAIIFFASLVGTGILYGQNPHAPDAPSLIEGNSSDSADKNAEQHPRSPASTEADPALPDYTHGLHLTPRLGYENTLYNQTGVPSLGQTALRGNLDLNWFIPRSSFGVDLRVNYTLLPLGSTRPELTARIFGAHLDLGYTVVNSSFIKVKLLGGAYYTSMTVTDQILGYPALIFPEIYPDLSLYLFNKITLNATYRFMYLGSIFDGSQTQLVRSLGMNIFINHNHSISALFEDNGFSILFPSLIQVQYYSMGLSLGYSF